MKSPLSAALVLAAAFALPDAAAAQDDLTTAAKVACVPDSVTRCTQAGQCTTREATPRDKSDVLLIDFAAKKVTTRRGGETRAEGDVTEDSVVDGVRRIAMTVGGGGQKVSMTLTKAGKLSIDMGAGGNKAEATCTAGS